MGWYRPTVKHPRRFSVIFQNPMFIDRFSSSPGPVVGIEETMRAKHSLTYLVMCLGWMLPITTVHSSQLIFWKDTRPWALSLSPCEYAPSWVVAKLPNSLSPAREQLAEWVGSRQLIFWAFPCPHILWVTQKAAAAATSGNSPRPLTASGYGERHARGMAYFTSS